MDIDVYAIAVLGVLYCVACVATHYILKWARKYTEDRILEYIDHNPELQEKLRDRYGWR